MGAEGGQLELFQRRGDLGPGLPPAPVFRGWGVLGRRLREFWDALSDWLNSPL